MAKNESGSEYRRRRIVIDFLKKTIYVEWLENKVIRGSLVGLALTTLLTVLIHAMFPGASHQTEEGKVNKKGHFWENLYPHNPVPPGHVEDDFQAGSLSHWLSRENVSNDWTYSTQGVRVGTARLHRDYFRLANYQMNARVFLDQPLTVIVRADSFEHYYGWKLSKRPVGGVPRLSKLDFLER